MEFFQLSFLLVTGNEWSDSENHLYFDNYQNVLFVCLI